MLIDSDGNELLEAAGGFEIETECLMSQTETIASRRTTVPTGELLGKNTVRSDAYLY